MFFTACQWEFSSLWIKIFYYDNNFATITISIVYMGQLKPKNIKQKQSNAT